MVSSEIVQLQREKKDLGTQINMLQESCTKIDEKFKQEVQNLKSYIEAAVPSGNPYDSTPKCRPISELVNNRLDYTLGKLRQDVNVVVYENTQLQVMKARINEDLEKCKQDKAIVTTEKNSLATEKTSLEKEVAVKKDELTKSYTLYLRKDEDLTLCRRQQVRSVPDDFWCIFSKFQNWLSAYNI